MSLPTVVIFGRANVGKSTLFNRLIEKPKALTAPIAGTTRNINRDEVYWRGVRFTLVDTGGIEAIIPRRRLKRMAPKENEPFATEIIKQTQRALTGADVILFVVDSQTGIVPEDRELARHLKHIKVPVILVGNKSDRSGASTRGGQLVALGVGDPHFVSAINGSGTGDLLDVVVSAIPKKLKKQKVIVRPPESLKIALIGRPNVGKSSLLNAIVGEELVIVSDIPHTTRESFDTQFVYEGRPFTLIDTAGLRRGTKVAEKSLERTGMKKSIISAQQSDLCLLIIDISQPLTVQDAHLAEMITEKKRGIVIVANKWDLIADKETNSPNLYTRYIYSTFPFLTWAPVVFISAKSKKGVRTLLKSIVSVADARAREFTDDELEVFLKQAIKAHRPAAAKGARAPRLLALRQTRTAPPVFELRIGPLDNLHAAYTRYLENRLRETYDLWGVPISITIVN